MASKLYQSGKALRDRADECRELARHFRKLNGRMKMLELAQEYDELARIAEELDASEQVKH
jgi:hypothetical protein